jgi:hypothetical protein
MTNISIYMNVEDPICLPRSISSGTAIVDAKELSFNAIMSWFPNEGTARLKAWGRMILRIAFPFGIPRLLAASICP